MGSNNLTLSSFHETFHRVLVAFHGTLPRSPALLPNKLKYLQPIELLPHHLRHIHP